MPRFDQKMGVRRPGHKDIGADRGDEFGMIPIGTLGHIGLFAPNLRRGGRQIAIPVVEGKGDSTHELTKTGSGRIAQHGHGGNGGESGDAIRAVATKGVEIGRRHDGIHFRPTGAAESALATGSLVALAGFGVTDDRGPSLDGIFGVFFSRLAPEIEKCSADEGIFDPDRTVNIPGIGNAALAAPGFIGWDLLVDDGVVESLKLPDHDAIFHVDFPTAGTRAVDPVGASHLFVVTPTGAVKTLPGPVFRGKNVLDPAHIIFSSVAVVCPGLVCCVGSAGGQTSRQVAPRQLRPPPWRSVWSALGGRSL